MSLRWQKWDDGVFAQSHVLDYAFRDGRSTQ